MAPGATRKALNVGGSKNGDDAGAAVEATIGSEHSVSKSEVSGSTCSAPNTAWACCIVTLEGW